MFRALIAAVAVLFLGNAVGLAVVDDDGDDRVAAVAPTTATTAFAPPTPTGPTTATTAPPDQLAALVQQLQAFVVEHRGLRFSQPLKYTLLGDAAFRERVLALAREDDDELVQAEKELRALGLLKAGVDLRKARDELLGAAVVGFYDPEKAELLVRGARITPYVRTTLVHEITHAVQDQNFHIEHPEYDDRDDEIELGFSAVAEGDAVRIEEAYRNTLSKSEREQAANEEAQVSRGTDLTKIPPILAQLLTFPYTEGRKLVSALLRAGGQARVDGAFREPPTTTEQVLHPEKFLAHEKPKPVANPSAEGPSVGSGVVGELVLRLLLATVLGDGATSAADGWGGDRYVSWTDGDATCVRVAYTMDTAADAQELRDGLTRWASRQERATVTGGDQPILTSCA
jgi:hypothetical protein